MIGAERTADVAAWSKSSCLAFRSLSAFHGHSVSIDYSGYSHLLRHFRQVLFVERSAMSLFFTNWTTISTSFIFRQVKDKDVRILLSLKEASANFGVKLFSAALLEENAQSWTMARHHSPLLSGPEVELPNSAEVPNVWSPCGNYGKSVILLSSNWRVRREEATESPHMPELQTP